MDIAIHIATQEKTLPRMRLTTQSAHSADSKIHEKMKNLHQMFDLLFLPNLGHLSEIKPLSLWIAS